MESSSLQQPPCGLHGAAVFLQDPAPLSTGTVPGMNAPSQRAGQCGPSPPWHQRAAESHSQDLKGNTVNTGPQIAGAESQGFPHSLLINPLFCPLSQFQFLFLKTRELLSLSRESAVSLVSTAESHCYLSAQQKEPCASHGGNYSRKDASG